MINFNKTDGYHLLPKKHRITAGILTAIAITLLSCGADDGLNINPVELGGSGGDPCHVGGSSGKGGFYGFPGLNVGGFAKHDAGIGSGGSCYKGGSAGRAGFELGGYGGFELGGHAGTNTGGKAGMGGIDAGTGGQSGTGGIDAGTGGISGSGGIDAGTGGISGSGGDAGLGGNSGTGGTADVPPTVVLTNPLNNDTIYSLKKTILFTFSEPMDQSTVASSFSLMNGLIPVQGTVNYISNQVNWSFTPDSNLELNTNYVATISTQVKDLAETQMTNNYSWNFTTSACALLPVVLNSAKSFVVLAGATITSTGPTSVTGDLGVSPGSAVVGFPPGNIVGIEHVGDTTASNAIFDLTAAYNDAAGRVLCPVSVAGNLGGMTLAPGLYKSTSSLAISSGDLVLDAKGDADALFIFQMASTLTTTSARQVILINGAQAGNVYWQVGTSATLGSTSSFFGTIMADQAITMETGATLTGRALARIAAVTLDSNVIVMPTP